MTSTENNDVPISVTMREVQELLRTFEEAGWASLDLTLGDLHIVLGRDGSPSTSVQAPAPNGTHGTPPAPAAAAPAPPPPAQTVPAPAAAAPAAPAQVAPQPTASAPAATGAAVEVRAPVVGTFWIAPSPGQPPFVEVGQKVDAGQQLGIVEVMKLMSDVSAPVAGTVVEIRAANASMVEYDEVLVIIEPSDD